MYYTYKKITTPGRLGTTYDFRFEYVMPDNISEEEINILEEQKNQCAYLGIYNNLHYCYVPDGYPLVNQHEICEVIPKESLSAEEANYLLEHGEYAKRILLDEARKTQKFYDQGPNNTGLNQQLYSQDYAYIMNSISSLANVLSYLLESSYTTLRARSDNNLDSNSIKTLEKLFNKSQEIKEKLNKVGL